MATKSETRVKHGEHPLMSHRILRGIFLGMTSVIAHLARSKRIAGAPPTRAALEDVPCWVAPLAGLSSVDLVLDCRAVDVALHLHPSARIAPRATDGTARLNMAIGAGALAASLSGRPVVFAFFERHEAERASWIEALARASELPILLIVLPRWRGRETSIDLGRLSRGAGVPGIPVDWQDPIALYRVAQESITRARAGGGAALLEAVRMPEGEDASQKLAEYLLVRGVASQGWIDAHSFRARDARSR